MGLYFFFKKSALEVIHLPKYFYRFCSGSYISLLGNPIMDMGDTEDVGRRLGMFMSILSIGALAGPPISGAIGTATGGYYLVSELLLSFLLCCKLPAEAQ